MTDNERIDKVLDAMAKSGNGRLHVQEFLIEEVKNKDLLSYQRIIPIIENKGYAERLAKLGAICMILSDGLDIVNSGGYIKYLERQKAADEEEAQSRKTKAKLDEVNLKLNGFYLKYKWVPFVLSLAAIIISLIALICS